LFIVGAYLYFLTNNSPVHWQFSCNSGDFLFFSCSHLIPILEISQINMKIHRIQREFLEFKGNIPNSRRISRIQGEYPEFKENIPNSKEISLIQRISIFLLIEKRLIRIFACYLTFRPHPQSDPCPPPIVWTTGLFAFTIS